MSTLSGDGSGKEQQHPEPLLTKAKLMAVFFVQLNEAYQITVLLPMVVFMVRDFGIAPVSLGIYTSILNASFCFCQFLCSYTWGLLSDKYGRRIALLIGLIFSTIAITLFGFSKNFGTAITARCISGFFNGNLGIIKAYLADVTDRSNRAFAFSTLAISYGFGSVIGSMCGGIFIETHNVDVIEGYEPTVGILKWWIFEYEYPFLLPCLIGGIISGNALIWTLIFVKDEKMVHFQYDSDNNDIESDKQTSNPTDDYQSLKSDKMMIESLDYQEGIKDDEYAQSLNNLSKLAICQTLPGDGIHSMTMSSPHKSIFSLRSNVSKNTEFQGLLMSNLKKNQNNKLSNITDENKNNDTYSSIMGLVFDTRLYVGLIIWTLLIMAFMMYQEMNPVYMAQALDFSSQWIGYSMAFSGFSLLIFTYYIQPYFLKTFRFRPMCIICGIAMCVVMLQMPGIFTIVSAAQFDNERMWSLILAFINSMAGVVFGSILFVCSMCWVNNAVPNACVGRANGLAQTLAALVRAIGPALTGFIWSASVEHIDDNSLSVYYAYLPSFVCCVVIALCVYLYITDDAQEMWEDRMLKDKNKHTIDK